MGESAAAPADGDASESTTGKRNRTAITKPAGPPVVVVADAGDIVLDLTFETSTETLRRERKASLATARKAGPGSQSSSSSGAALQPKVKVAYRVSLEALKKHSKYFSHLLSNPQFREATLISVAHDALAVRKIKPGEADAVDLPWIPISDDDEATRAAGREHAFEDLLRIIHQKPPKKSVVNMSYVATMAIIADRFDCVAAISHSLNTLLKFKWPVTSNRPFQDDTGRVTDAEQVLRQKILVSWLLGQPLRLQQSSRELITRGSRLWSPFHETDSEMTAAWWNLPEGLENELQCRRECIINTVASIQRHFLALFSSKERQCKLGYDSSAACDSFQLGQMLRFLLGKNLAFLVDFSPISLESVPDTAMLDIEELLSTLRQCPNYQVDKHHNNCGLRIRIDPILDYIRAMLSANFVSISYAEWKKRRTEVSWVVSKETGDKEDGSTRTFAFTRALSTDQRLRYEGALYADRMAKNLFLAETWDWTPEA